MGAFFYWTAPRKKLESGKTAPFKISENHHSQHVFLNANACHHILR